MHLRLLPFVLWVLVVSARAADQSADVIVYGATPAGVCAAIGAAREGARVLLLEPTGHVGGVNTGGLCFSDSNQTVRSTLGGLFEEFHLRIEADYAERGVALPYKVAEKDHKPWTYEPHVAAQVTNAMLAEAGVQVMTHEVLKTVEKDGARLEQLRTDQGDVFTARTFIDATYEGDLMALAKVGYTIGREPRTLFNESLAGKQYPKPPMAFSGLDNEGGRLLPLLTTINAGPDEDGDHHVMTYSFRLCLTDNPDNRVAFPEPAHYDPHRFEAVRRYFAQEKKPVLLWDLYPLPGDKVDANNGIGKQFSMGIIGGGDFWCQAGTEEREQIWEKHRQYTLEMYHFLTTDPAVPQALRDTLSQYGLCKDEFPETGHWSPQLYVREGRRMCGALVMTQADIRSDGAKPDAIAVGSFPIDSHDCQRVARGTGEVINEGTIFPVRENGHGHPYQIPFRAITPKAEECSNLLVPVALSATHVAYCSIRVEPTWMVIGHSAGIAAALAAKEHVAVQSLNYKKLRERLTGQKQILDLPNMAQEPVPPAVPDLALEPAEINLSPGPEYSDEQRDFAMVIGMDSTPRGRIWAAWVAGGDSDKGYFLAATSDDRGATWSKPRFVIHPPPAPNGLRRRALVGNFWTDPSGKLWLFYDQSMGYFDGRAGVWAITCENPDAESPTWSKPRRIWHGSTLNKPIVTKRGEWLLPISLWPRDRIGPAELRDGFHELDDQRMAHLFVSTDQGKTWTRRGGVIIPQSEFDEHMFVELKDGRLWMLARTKYGIAETFSSDDGRSWTEPKSSAIQNPSARFFLRRLASGRLLLVKNGPLDMRVGRSQITAFLSEDEGQSWKGGLVLDERQGVSYPDGFESPDGTLFILHDHGRSKDREIVLERFNEADVLAGKLISPGSQTKILVNKALGTPLPATTP